MSFDFEASVVAPFRMQPGLRRVPADRPVLTPAVVPHRGIARHLREKMAVLGAFADQALCAVPGFDAEPALAALAARAAADHPDALRIDGHTWQAPWLGWALDAALNPQPIGHDWPEIGPLLGRLAPGWRRAALLSLAFAEDLAIVDADTGTLPWMAVALPSSWAPEHKVGLHFAAAHAPVADNRLVMDAADRLLALVTAGERWERFVWTLTPHRRLHAHPDRTPAADGPEGWPLALSGDALAAQTWFRTEHQGFLPVPGRRQAVFTIAVDTRPLPQALADAAQARRLHDSLASMSDAVLAYRGLARARGPLLGWLATRAGPATVTPPDRPGAARPADA